jgi:hypothetical protein
MISKTPEGFSAIGSLGAPAAGDYLCSDDELYYVEYVGPERVVIEDCRSGTLLDVPIAYTAALRPVTPEAVRAA